jgi:hypothetical protein
MINNARCVREMSPSTAMGKEAFNRKKILFTSKLNVNFGNRIVNCYVWSIAMHVPENWTSESRL